MTNDEIRIAIAETVGWKDVRFIGDDACITGIKPNYPDYPNPARFELPNYPSDLNAMHEVVMAQDKAFRKVMRFWLYELTDQMSAHDATALQRAEAYLRVKGLWK